MDEARVSKISAALSILKKGMPFLATAIFALAVYFVHKLLKPYSYGEIIGYIEAIPPRRFLASVALTIASYSLLSCYDLLAVRYVKKSLPPGQVAFASFMAFAFSNTIGLANLAGSSVRLRLYPYFGLEARDVLKMIAFISLSFWLGFFALAGAVLSLHPVALPLEYGLPPGILRLVGFGLLAVVFAYLGLVAFRKEPLRLGGRTLDLPTFRLSLLQVLVAAGDWALAGAALFFLLPPSPSLGYFHFLSIFLSAQLAALLSHVPAGAGVLEAVITQFVGPDHHPTPAIVGGLIAYRLVYYLAPLILAAVALAFFEAYRQRAKVQSVSKTAFRWTSQLAPPVAAMLVFLAGAVLLFSGASPAERERLEFLRHRVPLLAIEISHFAGSVVGMALLVLARGLVNRGHAAWVFTTALMSLGVIFSLAKGFDYEEAILLTFFVAFLLSCRREFYRKSPLFSDSLSASWLISCFIVIGFSIWLGFFTNKHVEYDSDLWWNFTVHGDASRFLRATVGVGACAAALALMKLLSPRGTPKNISEVPPAEVRALVQAAPDTMANLAMVGDKKIFASEKRDAFLMYVTQGSTWAVLGDPVGNQEAFSDLLYDFKEAADSYGGAVAFYQVRSDNLPLYIDLGMIFLKLGEEARVNLKEFALDGKGRKGLRYYYTRSLKSNPLTFEVVPAARFDEILPEIRAVSDAWLSEKSTREKGFSLGYFDPEYLRHYPIAVLRDAEGKIQTFANVWANSAKEELSVDLMRYREPGGSNTMQRLMIELMLWGKAEGYAWFNLGMAPLSGLATGRLGSRWNRAGRLLFQHGERFYNFQGLRAYKEKFDPEWEPRYLAYSGKLQLPKALADLAVIIAGGVKGMVGK